MSDIICLSSSEDTDEEGNPKTKNIKRRLSLSLSAIQAKKRKLNPELNHCSEIKDEDPKPGTSGQPPKQYFSDSSGRSASSPLKPQLIVAEKVAIPDPSEDLFEELINTCKAKKSDDTTLKILSNLSKRYEQLSEVYKKNEEFRIFLRKYIQKISTGLNDKFYVHIQEVHNEIKRRIKKPVKSKDKKLKLDSSPKKNLGKQSIDEQKNIAEHQKDKNEIMDSLELNEQVLMLSKENRTRVKKLEKAITKCKQKIKELEEKEVEWDDEEDSVYLQEDRYKRKLVQLCQMLSEIVDDKMLKKEIYKKQLRRKDISGELSGIPSIDDAIINFININIKQINRLKHIKNPNAVTDYLQVPDVHDILEIIKKCNIKQDLELSKKKMESIATIAFKTLGKNLQKKRMRESEEYISSLITLESEKDPALKNPELHEKLKKNKKEGDTKLDDIFKKFVQKQEGLSEEDLKKEINVNSDSSEESENDAIEAKNKNRKKKFNSILSDNDDNDDISKSSPISNHHEKNNEDEKKDKNRSTEEQKTFSERDKENLQKKPEIKIKNIEVILNSPKVDEKNHENLIEKKIDEKNHENLIEKKIDEKNHENLIEKKIGEKSFSKESSPKKRIPEDEVLKFLNDDDKSTEKLSKDLEGDSLDFDKKVEEKKEHTKKSDQTDKDKKTCENVAQNNDSEEAEIIIEVAEVQEKINIEEEAEECLSNLMTDKDEESDLKSPFIKVCSFAKPPVTWKDSLSPQKPGRYSVIKNLQASPKENKVVSIDLTDENEDDESLSLESNKKCINPMALKAGSSHRHRPVTKNVVVVKNVINNYNVTPNDASSSGSSFKSSRTMKISNSIEGAGSTHWISKSPGRTFVKQISPRSHKKSSPISPYSDMSKNRSGRNKIQAFPFND